jgi:thiamine pyrophosphate-dependent acetolactate synthase large subunit-like protein
VTANPAEPVRSAKRTVDVLAACVVRPGTPIVSVSGDGGFGAHGYRVKTLDEFSATLRRALAEDGPSLIDVPVDYSRNTDLAAHLHDDPFE